MVPCSGLILYLTKATPSETVVAQIHVLAGRDLALDVLAVEMDSPVLCSLVLPFQVTEKLQSR